MAALRQASTCPIQTTTASSDDLADDAMTWRSWSVIVWTLIVALVIGAILCDNIAAAIVAGVFAVLWTHERRTRDADDWPTS